MARTRYVRIDISMPGTDEGCRACAAGWHAESHGRTDRWEGYRVDQVASVAAAYRQAGGSVRLAS